MTDTATLAATTAATDHPDELFGHPKGLYVCFFTEMWERFSFYGMKALLALYLIKHHGFSDAESLSVLGAYGGLVYATPVLGGLLADRYLGMRKAVVLGGVLLCLGHLGMAVEGHAATIGADGVVHRDLFALSVFYLSLALIISGVGFLKPNISTVVGKLYPEGDPRLDSGFTLFYAGINVGALFSALICGYLGDRFGWGYGFGAAGIGMLAGLTVFLTGQKYLQGHAEPPNPEALRRRLLGPLNVEWTIYLCAALALPVLWALMQLGSAVLWLQLLTMAVWLGWLGWYVTARCNPVQRQQMLACVFFVAICLLFFALYEQTYGSWVLFNDRMLTKDLFPSLVIREGHLVPWSILPLLLSPFVVAAALRMRSGLMPTLLLGGLTLLGTVLIIRDCVVLPQSASSLTYLGALFIVLLSPIMAWLWPFLERYGMNPSKPVKSAIGLAFAGLAFLPLIAGNQTVGADGLGSVWWIVLAYLLIEIGEVALSPIGLSAVTQLSVPQVAGLMMGAWWLGTSFSEQLASIFGKFAALDIPADGKIDMAVAQAKYGELFQHMVWLGLGAAVLALVLTPVVRRWMHGVR
ncbi:proton-dependent oligopeptide transporter, POT family [Dyella sp. OK004]|uniref:peptide MFS transporter n=1 Tax=Dyella sp. OK004 TaxID=1855292 RepID=UPI0008DEF78B|nr:oligopeptide:H+ symporter [Dyella sp. OK004]SFS05803.1 proton-dependent oligopeptide transporter, POT family [Dyella sp. OK004]